MFLCVAMKIYFIFMPILLFFRRVLLKWTSKQQLNWRSKKQRYMNNKACLVLQLIFLCAWTIESSLLLCKGHQRITLLQISHKRLKQQFARKLDELASSETNRSLQAARVQQLVRKASAHVFIFANNGLTYAVCLASFWKFSAFKYHFPSAALTM